MTQPERYVFDTNVLISALLFVTSKSGQAVLMARERGVILLSAAVVQELDAVLRRPKFDRYLRPEERERFLMALIQEVELVDIVVEVQMCRDPNDNKILDVAINGAATAIITEDEDLLVLHPFEGIPILKPDALLASVEAAANDGEA